MKRDETEPVADDAEDESEVEAGDEKGVEAVEVGADADAESTTPETPDRRGRAMKEPPPPKNWRVEAQSPEGIRVTLGRFVTREEAEPEVERIKQDGFYSKVRLIESA